MGGFLSAPYWRFGDAAEGWMGVIDCTEIVEAPFCLSLVDTNWIEGDEDVS